MARLGKRIIAKLSLPRKSDAQKEFLELVHRFAGRIEHIERTPEAEDWDFDRVMVEISMGCEVAA